MPPRVFPAQANMVDSIVESYGYLTDVMRSYAGHEQRVQLRAHPTGGVEYSFMCDNAQDSAAVDGALYADQAGTWAVPLWMYATPLTSAVSAGDTALPCDIADIPFLDPLGLGRYVLLWANARSYELAELIGASGGQVDLVTGVAAAWGAGTFVVPVRIGRLDQVIETRWLTPTVLTGRVAFTFDAAADPGSMVQFVLFGGGPAPLGPGG